MIFTDFGSRKTRKFVLAPGFIDQFRGKQPKWGYDGLGYLTYKRTYARPTCDCDNPDTCGHPTEEFWQTTQRVVEGVYNVQKIHCRNLNLPWSEQKAQRSAQEMFQRMWDFKFSPPGRGLWVMGTDLLYLKGSASLNNCFAAETEIITASGVKRIGDVVGTTQTLLTKNGSWVDAPIRSFGKQRLYKLYLSRQGVEKVVYCTGDHRWFARDRRNAHRDSGFVEFKTTELRPEVHRLQYVFGQSAAKGNVKPSPFGIAHGFTFGDGRTTPGERHANTVSLFGEKDAALKPYFDLCPPQSLEEGLQFGGLPNFFRTLPSIQENSSYLLGWLMGYFAADGSVKGGQVVISSVKQENIEFVRDVCVKLGIGTYALRAETRESNLTGRDFTMHSMSLMRDTLDESFFLIPAHRQSYHENGGDEVDRKYWNVKHLEETDRYEEVYCATVEGYGAFALEGNILTGNCGYTTTADIDTDFAGPFCFLMDMSMFGVGVGGDTKGAGKVKIITPRTTEVPYVVEDSREGWVELARVVLNSFVGKGAFPLTIDFSQVRKRGTPLKTFGGIASGPDPLVALVKNLVKLLLPGGVTVEFGGYEQECGVLTIAFSGENTEGCKITSPQIVDIFNYVGKCVVSGGIRRTAEIMFGDPTDKDFLSLKQDTVALNDRRWASNNSIFAQKGMDYTEIAAAIAVNGEPGVAWLENMRAFSRMNGAPDYKDARVMGSNPCVEQSLEDRELCCLVETYPAHHDSLEDYKRTLKFAYLYGKTVTLVPTHDPRTNAVVMRNRRIGCSQSGIIQAVSKFGRTEYKRWCDEGYNSIQEWDKTYSEWLCVPRSIKTTSVKPSGTVSLLAGATPGIHYAHSEFYIRHVRVANTSPLVQACRDAGYEVYADPYAPDTSVVAFPVHERNFQRSKDDVGIWEQFANAAMLQRYWADNQVSITVTFRKDEADQIKHCLEAFEDQLKAISLLPLADSDHGYSYAPYVKIDRDTYERMAVKVKPIIMDNVSHEMTDSFCDGGSCTILPAAVEA